MERTNLYNTMTEIARIRRASVETKAKDFSTRKINTFVKDEYVRQWKDEAGHKHKEKCWQYIYRDPTEEEVKELYNKYIKSNLSSIWIKVKPEDCETAFSFALFENPTEDFIDQIKNSIPQLYREHFNGFSFKVRKDSWDICEDVKEICVTFEGETQEKFTQSYNDYIKAKSDFCARYGCD